MTTRPSCRLSRLTGLAALIVSALAFPFPGIASADDKTFNFNVSPNGYPPYLIVEGSRPSGIMWDVVSLITERLGYQLVAQKIPRKRVEQMLLKGYLDGTPRAKEWTDQPDQFLFTDPVVDIEEVFFTPKRKGERFESIEDLEAKTLVTHLGYQYPKLEPHFSAGTIKRFDVSRDRDMFTFVLHGDRFDAAIADRLVGRWILRNEGLQDDFRTSREGISHYGFRIMLRKDLTAFSEAFNRELRRIREDGELDAILENYR